MSIRVKVKQSSKCKKCDGVGYYSFPFNTTEHEGSVEYVCSDCNGTGKTWKNRDLPLSSLKKLLK